MEKVRIQDDLYLYVNQEKIEELVIPDDMPTTGGFSTLNTEVEKLMMSEFNEMCEKESFKNDYLKRACALYKAARNVEKKNADGIAPALKYIEPIKNLDSIATFNKELKNLIL
ncbi:MAG: endopeptidase, partial [Clostridia bacterium]|nr:endopeptidase [Clostridia bacterium]